MDWDDILYLVLLFSSIGFGYFYRKFQSAEDKKVIGTIVGVTIILIVSGLHSIHTVIFTLINCLIILNISKRKCHLVSFAFSFGYLIFFRTTIYFGIPYPPAHTNLIIMMLTLKLVGLAFEINTSHMKNHDSSEKVMNDNEFIEVDPKFIDIIHYAFNFVAILTGPYVSYKTYWDSMYLPYSKHAGCESATLKRLTCVPLYAVLFLWATYTWPLSYALSDEFYAERSVLYRFWYTVPIFFIFRMRIYIGILLSECVCIMAGVGAYPEIADSKPGRGPSSEFSVLKQVELCKDTKKLEQIEYNFNAITNIEPYETEVCTTFREAMKHWNICVQYWMAVNVYKRFPSKQFRTLVTLFVSSVWHGVYIGHYFTITGAPFYLPIEDLYVKLFLKNNQGKSAVIWKCLIWISKMLAFGYLGMAFQLLTVPKVMHFYNSIYHIGAVVGIVLYIIGVLIAQSRPKKSKVSDETKKVN